ncbi:MAG TPA: SLBB domain-containing protein, partial [Spongiibacteraceae bacterium]|nr:SLBB domain-containing protein [Spongiibacteraceae bacterium]
MQKIRKVIGIFLLGVSSGFWLSPAIAQPTPVITAAQIEKFKQLPADQQQALAAQYGIDLQSLTGASAVQEQKPAPAPAVMAPRPAVTVVKDEQTGEQALKPYGYDLFAGSPTTFEPLSDIPIPTNYVLGPGDTLTIQLFGKESANYSLTVNRDGSILLPDLGPITVAGSSLDAARALIAQKIQKEKIGVTANITLGELRAIRVFVLGEAYQSGSYSVSSLSTITNALFLAGGVKEGGSLRNIQLKRHGNLIRTLDLYDLLMRGDTSNDVQLQPGDAIFIPQVGARVGVDGEVQRPAIYEIKNNETINDVLAMAGGVKPEAYPSASVVERFDRQHVRTLVNADLTNDRDRQLRVQRGDLIRVRSTAASVENAVAVVGAANRPGLYQWRAGMRVTDILRSRTNDLHANTDLDYALIVREVDYRGNIEVIQFNLGNALGDPASMDNRQLLARDRILVFQRFEFDASREAVLSDLLQKQAQSAQERTTQSLTTEATTDSGSQVEQGQASVLSSELLKKIQDKQLQVQRSAYQLAEKGLAAYSDATFLAQTRLFTRKQLLAPVIAQLREQGKAGAPIRIAEITGAVKFPGEYPIGKYGNARDLIIAAGGLVDSAYTETVELTRFNPGSLGNEVVHQQLPLAQVLAASDNSFALQSRDSLNVMTEPSYQ